MSESPHSGNTSRPGRLSACEWCGGILPDGSRADRRFCSANCRKESNRKTGRVASVRRLKSGLMSVVIHMHDAGLKPGDQVSLRTPE